jgi:hypothetical protein
MKAEEQGTEEENVAMVPAEEAPTTAMVPTEEAPTAEPNLAQSF